MEKSYEYILRLTKECAKSLVDEFSATHRRFPQGSYPKEVSASIVQWFEKREKNVQLFPDSNIVMSQKPNVSHMKFRGTTKDSDFIMTGTLTAFTVPDDRGESQAFVKALVFSVDKSNFVRKRL